MSHPRPRGSSALQLARLTEIGDASTNVQRGTRAHGELELMVSDLLRGELLPAFDLESWTPPE
jgi:hypothetical protein